MDLHTQMGAGNKSELKHMRVITEEEKEQRQSVYQNKIQEEKNLPNKTGNNLTK